MKKTLVAGLLVTAVSTSCFSPVNTFAESKTTYSQLANTPNEVAMNRLSNSIKTLGSQTPLLQGYGLIILKQPNLEVNAIHGITNDQRNARNHVQSWLDVYNPKLIDVNLDMQRFGTRFTNYYDILVELAQKVNEDSEAKEEFVSAFNDLQTQVQAIQYNMKGTSVDLINYKNEVVEDSESFSNKVSRAIELNNSSNGDIEKLRTEIAKLDEEIQNETEKILNLPKQNLEGSLNIGKSIVKIWIKGGTEKTVDVSDFELTYEQYKNIPNNEVAKLNNNIHQKQQQKIQLLQKLANIEIQATQMTLIDLQLNKFTKLIKKQAQNFDNAVDSWALFNETMIQMKTSLNTDAKIDSNVLQTQLKELKNFTDELNKQTKEYEDSITKINVKE